MDQDIPRVIFLHRLVIFGKTQLQRIVLTMQFFGRNGLANHASACAFGFLLSAAPALLLVSFFLFTAFNSLIATPGSSLDPRILSALADDIPILKDISNETWLVNNLSAFTQSGMRFHGITGIISIAGIFWAGRVFALSLQRGLKIIFAGTRKRNPIIDTMAVFLVEFAVAVSVLLMIFFSGAARWIYRILGEFPGASVFLSTLSRLNINVVFLGILALVFYVVCRYLTANGPSRRSALLGSFWCVLFSAVATRFLTMLQIQTRYNFLYGTLGSLVILLVNVYFFFMIFFICAQLARVLDSFDVLLFMKLRQARAKTRPGLLDKLYCSVEGKMQKYIRSYPKGSTIFSRGDSGEDVYYLLEGKVSVAMLSEDSGEKPAVLEKGAFFGEMDYLLSENRSATVKTKSKVSVLVLPPDYFADMLKYDTTIHRTIIEHLSQKLKTRDEQYNALFNQDL